MSVSASILIPTWNSPLTLRFALTSALRQTRSDIEILVVGDGVTDKTRELVSEFQEHDPRVTFLDLPKGENRGERNRHIGVLRASGDVIVYLADDDILMPRHVENLLDLIETAPFVQTRNTYIDSNNELQLHPTDLSDSRWIAWHLEDPPRNRVSITGTAHTKALYLELSEGWNVAPPGIWTDLYLWRQFFRLPNFRGATHNEVTALQFPAPFRSETSDEELTNLYEYWFQFSQSHDGHEKLQKLADDSTMRTLIQLSAITDDRFFHIHQQSQMIEQLNLEIGELRAFVSDLRTEAEQCTAALSESTGRSESLRAKLLAERRAKNELEATLARVRSSVLWRLSKPLRWLRRRVLRK